MGGGLDIEAAVHEVREAIRLNPGSAHGYRLLGRAFFLLPKPTLEHVRELSRGVARGADSSQVQFYRALLCERMGMKTEYVADLRQLGSAADTPPSLRRSVQERLEREDFRITQERVETLTSEKDFVAARASLAKSRVPE